MRSKRTRQEARQIEEMMKAEGGEEKNRRTRKYGERERDKSNLGRLKMEEFQTEVDRIKKTVKETDSRRWAEVREGREAD